MVPAEPFYLLKEHFAIDLPSARVVFTTRRGGHSTGPFQSLNLGRLTGDDPDAVARNRATVEADLGIRLGYVHQVHGEIVHRLAKHNSDRHAASSAQLPRGDGLVSTDPGLAPAVLTADCLPVAVAGEGGVTMLHAGWRGLRDGVIAAGITALRKAGAKGELSAAIGPGAGRCCYEVSDELHEEFAGYPADVHRGANLDLKAIARHQLERAGVIRVDDIEICTICSEPGLLFSHRRDRGLTGRQAGIAWCS